jgi:hypothetical protein
VSAAGVFKRTRPAGDSASGSCLCHERLLLEFTHRPNQLERFVLADRVFERVVFVPPGERGVDAEVFGIGRRLGGNANVNTQGCLDLLLILSPRDVHAEGLMLVVENAGALFHPSVIVELLHPRIRR